MRRWDRHAEARAFEQRLLTSIQSIELPRPYEYQAWLDAYLDAREDEDLILRPAFKTMRVKKENVGDKVLIGIGPQRPETVLDDVLTLRGNARLSFGLILLPADNRSILHTAYFRLELPEDRGSKIIRIELEDHSASIQSGNLDPTHPLKSALHLHVNDCAAHLPFPPMEPRAILDHIFFEILPFA